MWSAPEKKYQLLWKIWYVFIIHVIIFIWNFAGVWLHESGVIGASPDGIVTHQTHCSGHTGILHFQTEAAKYLEAELIEVKCPYSAKDMKIKDAVKTVPGFFLGMIKCFMIHFVQYYPSFFSWKCFVSIRLITKSMNNVFFRNSRWVFAHKRWQWLLQSNSRAAVHHQEEMLRFSSMDTNRSGYHSHCKGQKLVSKHRENHRFLF